MADDKPKTVAQYLDSDTFNWNPQGFDRAQKILDRGKQALVAPYAAAQRGDVGLIPAAKAAWGGLMGTEPKSSFSDVAGKYAEQHDVQNPIALGALATAGAGADLTLDLTNLVPGMKAEKALSGTIANVAKHNALKATAKDVTSHALKTGDLSTVNQIVQKSADDLAKIMPSEAHSGARVWSQLEGPKLIQGSGEFKKPAIKPQNISKVQFGYKTPASSNEFAKPLIKKQNISKVGPPTPEGELRSAGKALSNAALSGKPLQFTPMVNTSNQVQVSKILDTLRKKVGP